MSKTTAKKAARFDPAALSEKQQELVVEHYLGAHPKYFEYHGLDLRVNIGLLNIEKKTLERMEKAESMVSKKIKRIMVIIPKTGTSYDREFMESYTHAKNWLMANYEVVSKAVGYQFGIFEYFCHTFPIDANRNECVAYALANDVHLTIWLDTDQEFPRDTLVKLMTHDLPIVAGIYHAKAEPYHPVVFRENPDSTNFDWFSAIINFPQDELFYADMIGMGCVAIKAEVLRELDKPYFKYRPQPLHDLEKDEYRLLKHKWGVNDVSEDVWFWKQVKDLTDYRIVIDPTIDVQHIMRFKVGRWLWRAYVEGVKKGIVDRHGEEFLKNMEAEVCPSPSTKSAS